MELNFDTLRNKKIKEAIKIYNELEDNELVKKYYDALQIIIKETEKMPKVEYYKSSKHYDYYIEKPYTRVEFLGDGKVGYKKHYYSAVGVRNNGIPKSVKYERYSLNFCLSLCKYSKEKIIAIIEKHIKEDNMIE